jgi:hypothetical protein
VFFYVDFILEQLLTTHVKAFEDSGRIRVMFCNMQLVKIVLFEVLAAQQALVHNGSGVHSFLVPL